MSGIFSYIFSGLKSSEDNIKNIKKILKRQNKLNSQITLFAATTTICIIVVEVRVIWQENRIKELTREVELLKEGRSNKTR